MCALVRTQVERVPSVPHGGGVLHDEETGGGLVLWVEERHITERGARQLEHNLNQEALAKGRRLTVDEVAALIPFVV